MACSACAKKAVLKNQRMIAKSLNASKKIKAKLNSNSNQKSKPKNEQ